MRKIHKKKNKLASRKLWAAAVGVFISLVAAFGLDDITTNNVVAVVTACSTLVAYIFGQGYVDAQEVQQGEYISHYCDDHCRSYRR